MVRGTIGGQSAGSFVPQLGLNGARRVPPVEMPVMLADQNGATATGTVE